MLERVAEAHTYFLFFFLVSFERRDLSRAALFLWITLFFAARSIELTASSMFFLVGLFLAFLSATSIRPMRRLLTICFLFELRRARLAVTVTGIVYRECISGFRVYEKSVKIATYGQKTDKK